MLVKELEIEDLEETRIKLKKKSQMIEQMNKLSNFMVGSTETTNEDPLSNIDDFSMKDSSTKVLLLT